MSLEQHNTLVRGTERERDDVQRAPALIARRRQQRPLGAGRVVEEIQNGARVDQRLAVGLHQRGDPAQRIELPDQLEVPVHRPVAVLERHLEEAQAHGHAPHKRRIEHSDQNHVSVSTFHSQPFRREALRELYLDARGLRSS